MKTIVIFGYPIFKPISMESPTNICHRSCPADLFDQSICMTLRQVLAENFSHVLDTADLNAFPTTNWKIVKTCNIRKVQVKFDKVWSLEVSFLRREQNAHIFAIALGFDRLDLIPRFKKYQSEMHRDGTQTTEKTWDQDLHCCTFESRSIL